MSGELHVEVTPLEPTLEAADAAVRAALGAPAVREELDGAEYRVLSVRPLIDDREEVPTAVRAPGPLSAASSAPVRAAPPPAGHRH